MNELFEHAGTAIAQSEVISFNFNGSAVRTLKDANGEPWFVAKDVAEILGYTDTQAMTRRLDDDEISSCTDKSSGQGRRITIINESGLYNAILGSNKPESKTFKRWVTSEVLPSIRKHGGYIAANSDMTDDEIMARALQVAQRTIDRKNMLIEQQAAQIDEQRKQLELQAPDADYCRKVLACETLITTNIVAGHLGISAKRLNQFLDYEGWIYRQGKTWCASQKIRSKNFCDYATYIYTDEYGHEQSSHLLKWTESGRKAVIELWNKRHNSGKGA